jgi:hypothetical protein
VFPYSELVGSLLYLAVCTRPDIAYAVGVLARYMSKPMLRHWNAAKSLLCYLVGTMQCGISFDGKGGNLEGYCDSDYAGDVDTRKSTAGYVFLLNGGVVSWFIRLPTTEKRLSTWLQLQLSRKLCG